MGVDTQATASASSSSNQEPKNQTPHSHFKFGSFSIILTLRLRRQTKKDTNFLFTKVNLPNSPKFSFTQQFPTLVKARCFLTTRKGSQNSGIRQESVVSSVLNVCILVVRKCFGPRSTGTCQSTLSAFIWGTCTSKTPRWTLSCYLSGPGKQRRSTLFLVAGPLYWHTTFPFNIFISLLYLDSFYCGFSQFWWVVPHFLCILDDPSPAVHTILSLAEVFIIWYPGLKP